MAQVSLEDLIAAGRSGAGLISFPTDTVPALAARPEQSGLIYATKQRSAAKPLILMGGEAEDLWDYVQGSVAEFEVWRRVATQYWPGALTLVLPASDRLPPQINPKDPTTIGIRVPNSAIARHILRQTGPLATTSLNRSGQPPLTTIAEINEQFPDVLTLSPEELDRWTTPLSSATATASGVPSTVAQWTGSGWSVLRQGVIELA